MSEQDEPRHDDGDGQGEERDEDRAQILERRKRMIASALAGLAIGVDGCERLTGSPAPCLAPVAVDRGVRPNVCLAYMPPAEGAPQPCLAQRVAAPDAGAPLEDGGARATGAGVATLFAGPADGGAAPRPCLSAVRPQVCLSVRASPDPSVPVTEAERKEVDPSEG